MPQLVQPSTLLNDHVSLASQGGEQVVISEVMQLSYVAQEECVGEDDDEEEEFDGTETSEEEVPNYLTESDTAAAQFEPASCTAAALHFDSTSHTTTTGATHCYSPPLDDDQYPGDDATMEEDTEEHNLEAELDTEFAMLDPKLDIQLEKELSRAVPKTGRGMDKGDDAPADSSQRKLLSLNRRGTFSHERFGRTATIIWKYLYDELVLFWSSWPEEKKRVAWENFQNDAHQKYVEKYGPNKDSWPECDPLIWKEASSSTTRILTTQVQQLQSELTQVREEMAERVQTKVVARIYTKVSHRVSEMEASFERRFQEHMCLLS
ncbi:hypothetical protein SLEP1_g56427 [Rubroshorea leprosula]|uniref:Uncharacterized protein n=1 Tax=Rubroshorea leprosula TaxID=152421 RepID=A0AAV5ML08_9ROSI|nr:hypothetical protein SLEP1_g56427 [Rubroshorea leprosula]